MPTLVTVLSLLIAAAPVLYALSHSQRHRSLLLRDAEIATHLPRDSDVRKRLERHVQNRVATMVDREEYGTAWRHGETAKAVGLAVLAVFLLALAVSEFPGAVGWAGTATAGIYGGWAIQVLAAEGLRRRRQQVRLATGEPATG